MKTLCNKLRVHNALVWIVMVLFLSGCADTIPQKQELQDVALYTLIAFDKAEDGYRITLGGVVPNGEDMLRVYTAQGASLSECIRTFERYPARHMTLGHLNFALIDEELVQDGFQKIVDMLSRAPQVRMSLGLYVISGAKGLDAMVKANTVERPLDTRLGNLDRSQPFNSVSAPISLAELVRQLLEDERACLPTVGLLPAPEIAPQNDEEEMELYAVGITLVDNNRYAALLDEELTRGYNLLRQRPFQDYVGLRLDDGLEAEVTLLHRESRVESLWEGETLTGFRVEIEAQGAIEGIYPWQTFVSGETSGSTRAIETATGQVLQQLAAEVIQDAQRRGIDYLDFEAAVRNRHPVRHAKLQDNWDAVFASLPVEVQVGCELSRSFELELNMTDQEV